MFDDLVQVRFAFGAVGLVYDDNCMVISSEKEANQLGVREGWIVVVVNGQPAQDGTSLTELLDKARRRCGWTPKSAQEFWKTVAEPRLEAAVEHWPGDKTERVNMVIAFLKRMAEREKSMASKLSKIDDMTIWFAKDARAADALMSVQQMKSSPSQTTHSCSALFRSLGGKEYTVRFDLDETLRVLRSRLAGVAGLFTDQVAIVLSDGTRLGERGRRRDDAQLLSECGVCDGMEAVMVTVGQPLDGCMECSVDERLKKLLTKEKAIVEAMLGWECEEFTPISYSAGLNPFQGEHGLSHLHFLQLSVMEQHPWEVNAILECVQKMRPLGEDVALNGSDLLRQPGLPHALANYDGKTLDQNLTQDVQRVVQTMENSITQEKLCSRLMNYSPAASILLSWLLSCLPSIASGKDTRWVKSLQAAELIVKCKIGQEKFIHVFVNVCNNQVKVEGIKEGRQLHDFIEWFRPGSQPSIAKAPVKKVEMVRTLRKVNAWR